MYNDIKNIVFFWLSMASKHEMLYLKTAKYWEKLEDN